MEILSKTKGLEDSATQVVGHLYRKCHALVTPELHFFRFPKAPETSLAPSSLQ